MAEVKSWSTSAGSNTSASPDGFPEGMAPSGVNDSAREVMAAIARYRSDTDGVANSTGSSNAYALASATTYTAYAQGDRFCFKANFANTGAATLNVDSVGARTIKRADGSDLLANDIPSGAVVDVVYDGTNFQIVSNVAVFPYRNVNNLTAAPTVNDDSGDGYSAGSIAVDVTNDRAYVCLDATAGAAIWRRIDSRVIQIVHSAQAGSSTSSTSYVNLSNSVVTITPISASSRILIEVSFNARISNVAATNPIGTFSLYETTAGTALGSEYALEAFSSAGGTGVGVPGVIRHRVNSSGTSSRSFGLQGKTSSGSAIASASFAVWTITEYFE